MRRIICLLHIFVLCLLCGCSAVPEQQEGLSVITPRLDMCSIYGDENGFYRVTTDMENRPGLNYTDFSDCTEKCVAEKIPLSPVAAANIFMAGKKVYLHTVDLAESTQHGNITSVLSQLADDGEIVAQTVFPANSMIGEMLVQDSRNIYAMLYSFSEKRANLIRINKTDLVYEILNDYNISARLLTVYGNCIILQNGKSVISYDTVAKQQSALLETDIDWYGSGDILVAAQGSASKVEIYDIPSAVQYQGSISSPGMIGNFRIYNDCLIPGYLTVQSTSEITGGNIVHLLNTATLEAHMAATGGEYMKNPILAYCDGKIILLETDDKVYPFTYIYKLMEADDYLSAVDEYTILEMKDR